MQVSGGSVGASGCLKGISGSSKIFLFFSLYFPLPLHLFTFKFLTPFPSLFGDPLS